MSECSSIGMLDAFDISYLMDSWPIHFQVLCRVRPPSCTCGKLWPSLLQWSWCATVNQSFPATCHYHRPANCCTVAFRRMKPATALASHPSDGHTLELATLPASAFRALCHYCMATIRAEVEFAFDIEALGPARLAYWTSPGIFVTASSRTSTLPIKNLVFRFHMNADFLGYAKLEPASHSHDT